MIELIGHATIEKGLGDSSDYVVDLAPSIAVLTDGSYFVAAYMYSFINGLVGPAEFWLNPDIIRMYHLAPDLSLLGKADIVLVPWADPLPVVFAVANNKVVILSQNKTGSPNAYRADLAYSSWIVDCSGDVPIAGPAIHMPTTHGGARYLQWEEPGSLRYGGDSMDFVFDEATDRLIVAVNGNAYNGTQYSVWGQPMLQVFRASTGVLLLEVAPRIACEFSMGLFMDPTDSTKFAMWAQDYTSSWDTTYGPHRPSLMRFTIANDGLSGTYDGRTLVPGEPDNYTQYGYSYNLGYKAALAGVSPYLPITPPLGFLNLGWVDPTNTSLGAEVDLYSLAGEKLATLHGDLGIYYLPRVDLAGGRYLIQGSERNFYLGSDRVYEGEAWCVDLLAVPPVMEVITFPYDAPAWSNARGSDIAANQDTGEIIFAENIQWSDAHYTLTLDVWKIQGPSGPKPNLSGGPIGVDVRFSRPGGGLL